ncbi:uncharacterized protein [Scyliorhinus torazame]|uniref:uncharacterized protein isoform X2 n=1 Tax=Scyliorhinus torazame TaxID=75743 RepID=UPI003B5B6FB6
MASRGPQDGGAAGPGRAEGESRQRQRGRGRGRRSRSSRGLVQLGEQIHRWSRLRRQLNLQSDEELARRLLDAFGKIHVSPSSPHQAVLQVCIREEGAMTHGAIRKEQGDAHNTIPFWPAGTVGNERTLTPPSASCKMEVPSESKPRGRRLRSDRFIEKRMNQPELSCPILEAVLVEGADVTHDSVKEDNDQEDLDSVPTLSAGSESTVTLSHPSSIGSLEEDTDVSLFSGVDSLSESTLKSPRVASRKPEQLPLPSPVAKVEPEDWESGSEGHRFDHYSSKNKDPCPRNTEMDLTVPSVTPEGLERRPSSDGEIIQVCIGDGIGSTCPSIKIEQEDLCSPPSPVTSGGSESTVTLSHPSSDLSFEEDCQLDTAEESESETEGLEEEAAAATRRRKWPPHADRHCGCELPGTLDIGGQIERWNLVKECLKLKSDEELARALLDLYTKTHSTSPSPLTTLAALVKKV